jgi:hypothetical protein
MSDQPTPNVKIYDRPARTGPSPLLVIIVLLVMLALGFVAYRVMYRPAAPVSQEKTGGTAIDRPTNGK